MLAGAKGSPGFQGQNTAPVVRRIRLPIRRNGQLFSYGKGLIILLPVFRPIFLLQGLRFHRAGAGVKAGGTGHGRGLLAHGFQDGGGVRLVLDIGLYPDIAAAVCKDAFVDIVPVVAFALIEGNIGGVLNGNACNAQRKEHVRHGVRAVCIGMYGNFNPLHSCCLLGSW